MEPNWIVVEKGKGTPWFEISIVHKKYGIGKNSHGWEGENKVIVINQNGINKWQMNDETWERLVKRARVIAEALNESEE